MSGGKSRRGACHQAINGVVTNGERKNVRESARREGVLAGVHEGSSVMANGGKLLKKR